MKQAMNIEEIESTGDYIYIYFTDVSTPLAVSKFRLYAWLSDNDMLHWSETPASPEEASKVNSGELSYSKYFDLPLIQIQIDVEKYINTIEL